MKIVIGVAAVVVVAIVAALVQQRGPLVRYLKIKRM